MTTLRRAALLLAMASFGPAAIAAALPSAAVPAVAPSGAAPVRAGTEAAQPVQGRDTGNLRCSGQAATPGSLTLALGKSTLMRMPEAVQARSVGNPAVLQAMLVAPDTLYVVGVDIGSSNMIVRGRSGVCNVIEVVVGVDPVALQSALAALMPTQKDIQVSAAGDTLVLSGTVDDAQTAARVLELAAAFVRRPAQALEAAKGDKGGAATPTPPASASAAGGAARIVNFLNVGAPQQVMLEVKIAEVSKTLLDKLETGLSLSFGGGSWSTTLASNFISGTLKGLLSGGKATGNHVGISAEKQDGLVRILAEPTVMAISGQEGSFLAGGKIFIPVAQDNNKITLEEKEFGIGLHFTPTVLAGGRINLRVAPEVSELSREGIGISAAGFSGGAILPLITTRRAATTVELFDGQSFAIGGLIRNTQTTNIHGLPVLGELPVLGALFRSSDFQQDRTELLFVVTPHLVKPLPPNYQLPTDSVTTPSRAQLFLEGRMEGPPAQSTEHK
ncbi:MULTISPECIES: type II and III secretion system protein family protein [unclassified Duganella]|uniref:type II and III secretion system protein family protein n=1 Tax=unclassified Duganella TaxID=2636909 RepID=UPI000E348534|nr:MULTISPECIES: type II and III secretion system protein family protein [unclassified Duganella]RFP12622.1 type II and III secretion system protein family protein [Duganella sp. BJB475]RFP28598.1 type II and III secretion system protein family protein [Duganella sp. BJB476]